ncbi:hypothetical protein BUALT_Bualt14G0015600 [Buddleja alternifolia]|uniref:DDE Tnp4 domain-containing protein n=1 Tax=Buddleja alternifolia TaxID=168488 RepID=A0AAV6WG07_9LAMI|nr:hypothetical protein BUALT_Bualt14G0015600 [Buddleja alternifolia]
MNFVYMLPGWEGSAANDRVLCDGVNRDNGLKVPNGFLAPYRSVRYHLDECSECCRAPQNAKELYHQRHTKASNVIERMWGIMKWQWAILRSTTFYSLCTQNRMILACALLYNFIHRKMEVDPAEAHVPENHQER